MNKTTEALKLAEEALSSVVSCPQEDAYWLWNVKQALSTIRETSIKSMQKPIGFIDAGDLRELSNGNERQYSLFVSDQGRMVAIYAAPVQPVKQEPVAYVYDREIAGIGYRKDVAFIKNVEIGTDLYAAPVDAKAIREQALEEAEEIAKTIGGKFADDFLAAIRSLK